MGIIRKRLNQFEGMPPNTRINPDTGVVEVTPDGGITWNPDEGGDPRQNPAYLLPATEEGNCAAAAGMVAHMQGFVTASSVIGTLPGLATWILGAFVPLLGISWFLIPALAIAGAILTIGGVAIAAAFTPEVWEQILCILYLNTDPDGQISTVQLDAAYDQIDAEIANAIVTAVVGHIFNAWGYVGMSNAGVVSADPEADCTACAPPECAECDSDNWTAAAFPNFSTGSLPAGFVVERDGVPFSDPLLYLAVDPNFASISFSERCIARIDYTGNTSGGHSPGVVCGDFTGAVASTVTFTPPKKVTEIFFYLATGTTPGGVSLTTMTIYWCEE